jgi:hypothetical protein
MSLSNAISSGTCATEVVGEVVGPWLVTWVAWLVTWVHGWCRESMTGVMDACTACHECTTSVVGEEQRRGRVSWALGTAPAPVDGGQAGVTWRCAHGDTAIEDEEREADVPAGSEVCIRVHHTAAHAPAAPALGLLAYQRLGR